MIGGTVGFGALPGGIELDLDLSDLRKALGDLRNRTTLTSRAGLSGLAPGLRCFTGRRDGARIPWARGAMSVPRADGDADSTPTAALPLPALPASGSAPAPALPAQPGVETDAPGAEPHRADPRPNRPGRPSSRALRNPAPRRPVDDAETTGGVAIGTGPGPEDPEQRNHVPRPTRSTGRGRAPVTAPDLDGEDVWELVRQAQAGDPQAFARIYDRYFDTVYRYISYRIGSRTVAEDLTSEVWLRALRRIGSVTWQGRDLGAWLVTIARNLIADHYKSARARLEVTTADMLEADDEAPGPEGRPEAEVLTRLDNATLLDAVRRLNPEQQECITLRFLQGLSVTETAQIMGKNDGAIKALQYRAVRTLGRLLPEGFTP
ncbi:ECF subfamily RNA polymerase sigma factor, BldN family [Cryptosporangium japonicum]|uniref:RNA polymerase sigma-70 factor (ECF subfamily) n=1 Tax=Cryptosporangium japonicum TaxID=80872 RepID=A0ABP3DHP0_9ACTN